MSVRFIRDEKHLAEMVLHVRKKNYESARRQFATDCPRGTVNLLHASMLYIEALEAARALR